MPIGTQEIDPVRSPNQTQTMFEQLNAIPRTLSLQDFIAEVDRITGGADRAGDPDGFALGTGAVNQFLAANNIPKQQPGSKDNLPVYLNLGGWGDYSASKDFSLAGNERGDIGTYSVGTTKRSDGNALDAFTSIAAPLLGNALLPGIGGVLGAAATGGTDGGGGSLLGTGGELFNIGNTLAGINDTSGKSSYEQPEHQKEDVSDVLGDVQLSIPDYQSILDAINNASGSGDSSTSTSASGLLPDSPLLENPPELEAGDLPVDSPFQQSPIGDEDSPFVHESEEEHDGELPYDPNWVANAEYILKSLENGTAGDRQGAFEEWKNRWEASGSPSTKDGMMTKEEYANQGKEDSGYVDLGLGLGGIVNTPSSGSGVGGTAPSTGGGGSGGGGAGTGEPPKIPIELPPILGGILPNDDDEDKDWWTVDLPPQDLSYGYTPTDYGTVEQRPLFDEPTRGLQAPMVTPADNSGQASYEEWLADYLKQPETQEGLLPMIQGKRTNGGLI